MISNLSHCTEKQKAIFLFIKDTISSRRYAPSMREIAKHFGIKSLNGVAGHLEALKKKGLIHSDAATARSIIIVDGAASADGRLAEIAEIIEAVDRRCLSADGPVTPTLQEMTQAEISRIYALTKGES